MADITRLMRSRNAHDPRNLVLGHFGTTRYDTEKEEWFCLRQESPMDQHGSAPLVCLHARMIPESHGPDTILDPTPRKEPSTIPDQVPKLKGLEAILGNLEDEKSASRHAATLHQVKPIFCYALSPYEPDTHRILLPVLVTLPTAESLSISVRAIRMNEVSDLDQNIPSLDDNSSDVRVPVIESILGFSVSADKTILAIRQTSVTTLCNLVLRTSQPNSRDRAAFGIDNVLILPTSRTGGYPHSCVAFHPTLSNLVAVVDEHGNWSLWKKTGRRTGSCRIVSALHLQNSGKLLPNRNGPLSQEIPFYDGWHNICWLDNMTSGRQLILVCSRRIARIFSLDGVARGDVDMRLGSRAANGHILDVQPSLVDRSICYILTTTRIIAMRLSNDDVGALDLRVLCSWTHFFDGRNLDLSISILEFATFRCLVLLGRCSQSRLFYLKASTFQGLVVVGEPRVLVLPYLIDDGLMLSTAALQLIDSGPIRTQKCDVNSKRQIKLIACGPTGQTFDLTFSTGWLDADGADVAGIELHSLRIASNREWRIKSSRIVDQDDDMLDFGVPDDISVQHIVSRPRNSLSNSSRIISQSRNWQDLLILEAGAADDSTTLESLILLEGQAESFSREQETVHSIAELIHESRIADIETFSSDVEEWRERNINRSEGSPQGLFRTVIGTATAGLSLNYHDLFDRFVEPLSQDLPDRAKVQTERISRQVAFDTYASGVILSKLITGISDILPAQPEQEPTPPGATGDRNPGESDNPILAALRRYTTFSASETETQSTTTASRVLAHLPLDLRDPISYSYGRIEERLREQQSHEAYLQLSDSERRRAERTKLRNQKKLAQQLRQRDAAMLNNSNIPGVSMLSQQADPREVQSSQAIPDLPPSSQAVTLPMTQPERGAHGERKLLRKKSSKRTKGF